LPQLRKEEYCVMWLNNLPKILDHYKRFTVGQGMEPLLSQLYIKIELLVGPKEIMKPG
jgi:hypothetical protein